MILGIIHVDYGKEQANVFLRSGGLGTDHVKLTVQSRPGNGIWSVISFYDEKNGNSETGVQQKDLNREIDF